MVNVFPVVLDDWLLRFVTGKETNNIVPWLCESTSKTDGNPLSQVCYAADKNCISIHVLEDTPEITLDMYVNLDCVENLT